MKFVGNKASELPAAKTEVIGKLRVKADALREEGITYRGNRFDVRESTEALARHYAQFAGYLEWRSCDNQMIDVPQEFFREVLTRANVIRKALWAHKDAVNALTTLNAVCAYDIEANWP